MTPGRFVFLVCVTAALAMVLVGQNVRLRRYGYRVESLRNELVRAHSERLACLAYISKLRNPTRIRRLIEQAGLPLQQKAASASPPHAGSAATVAQVLDLSTEGGRPQR